VLDFVPPPPAFFAFSRDKGESQKHAQHDHRSDQQDKSFHRWRKQGKYRIEPEEKVIRPRRGLDNGRIGLAGWVGPAQPGSISNGGKGEKSFAATT
jgi:hypothetical protein